MRRGTDARPEPNRPCVRADGDPPGPPPVLRSCPNCGHRGTETVCPEDDVPMFEHRALDFQTVPTGYIGEVLGGRYQLEELVGESCVGCAFRALDLDTGDTVAVKVVRRQVTRDGGALDRFRSEARASSRLACEHTVRIRDLAASDDGRVYVVRDFLVGRTLEDALEAAGPLAPAEAVDIGLAICASLAEAHELGLLHRDLKPSNVFLVPGPDGREHVQVLNLGLGCFVGELLRDPILRALATTNGGYRYMSPEQVRGDLLDTRSDLYSLGVLLYELLFGELPFSAELIDERPGGGWRIAPPPVPTEASGRPVRPDLRALLGELLHPCVVGRPPAAWRVAERLRVLRTELEADRRWRRPRLPSTTRGWFGRRRRRHTTGPARPYHERFTAALTRLLGL